MIKTVKLRTGKIVPEPVVATTMIALYELAECDKVALYDLVKLCKDDKKIFWQSSRNALQKLSLIQPNDRVHDDVREIVLAAVKFNGTSSVTITDPIVDSD
jgi:hypothetical protein